MVFPSNLISPLIFKFYCLLYFLGSKITQQIPKTCFLCYDYSNAQSEEILGVYLLQFMRYGSVTDGQTDRQRNLNIKALFYHPLGMER